MIGNQMMVHHLRPWHLYSCDGICTRSSLHRRPPSLVLPHVLPLWSCEYLWDVSSHDQILVCYHISSAIMEILFIVYYMWRWPHMTFVYHAYSWPLHSYVSRTSTCTFTVTCWDLSLYCTREWLVLPPGSSLLHFWDGYNVFWPSCYPFDLTH